MPRTRREAEAVGGTRNLGAAPLSGRTLRIAVGIVTAGRPTMLPEVLAELRHQTRAPDRLIVCHAVPSDVSFVPPGAAELLASRPGIAVQRNRVLDAVGDCDVVVFFDDDFLPAADWLAKAEALFLRDRHAVVITGHVLADGAKGPGIAPEAGRLVLRADAGGDGAMPADNGYGCNMALRLAPMRTHGLRFDERLPLYGWYEDIDLTRRLGRHGNILRCYGARGVHLGVKSGRVSGVRMGYSQIANPIYLARKGSYPWLHALKSMGRHLAANLLRSLAPEPWVDRRGRLRGNCIALADALRGRLVPERILTL